MKSLRLHWALAFAATVVATAASAQQGYGSDPGRYSSYNDRVLVRCESQDERTRYCSTDIRGDVRLVNQLSRSPCIEGRTWGWDRQGLWVTEGCRAEFEIDPGYGNGDDRDYGRNRVVRCESTNSRTSSLERLALYSATTGTKACEKAPSANNRRNRLGIWLARTNTSMNTEGMIVAYTTSRTSPVMRDRRVVIPTMAVLRKKPRLMGDRARS